MKSKILKFTIWEIGSGHLEKLSREYLHWLRTYKLLVYVLLLVYLLLFTIFKKGIFICAINTCMKDLKYVLTINIKSLFQKIRSKICK